MNVITLSEEAFYALFEKVIAHIQAEHKDNPDRWINGEEAAHMLRIKSKTTMAMLRSAGKIRYSQEGKRILYDVLSIHEYLEKHSKETF